MVAVNVSIPEGYTGYVPTIDSMGSLVVAEKMKFQSMKFGNKGSTVVVIANIVASTLFIEAYVVVVVDARIEVEELRIEAAWVYLLNGAELEAPKLVCNGSIRRGGELGKIDLVYLKNMGITPCSA